MDGDTTDAMKRKPLILIIRGPSGVGKSTVSHQLLIKLSKKNVLYFEQDHFKNVMSEHTSDPRALSAAMLYACTSTAIQEGSSVIIEES